MPSSYALRIAAAITITILISQSTARELRPSDHGLGYQIIPPTGLKLPDTMSFFGATSNSSSSSSSTPSTVAFPKATDSSNDTSWWSAGGNRRGSDRLRKMLLWGSLSCGIAGVALLGVSAFVYLSKTRPSSPSTHSSNYTNNTNTLVAIAK